MGGSDLKANLGLNGNHNGSGGRNRNGRGGSSPSRSSGGSGCCSCSTSSGRSTWSWLLFVLVLVSLAASILVFWMTLYKQQALQIRMMGLEEERNKTLHDMVSREMSNLKFLAMRNERSLEEHSKEIASLLRRVGSAEAEAERRGMREMEMRDWVEQEIRKISTAHGAVINRLSEKVSGWESTNAVTVRALNKLKTSLDSAREADRSSAASAAAGARTNAEGVEALREEMEGVWASMEEGRQRVKQQGKDILEIKSLAADMQALRDEFTSALSASERSTESRLLEASSLAAEAADAATTAREVALVAAAEAQAALNATARLREAAEEDEARWRRRRLREEEVMAEAEIWREETLRELSVMNATLLRRLDELALLARPVREVHNVTEEEEEEEAEDGTMLVPSEVLILLNASRDATSDLESDLDSLRREVSALALAQRAQLGTAQEMESALERMGERGEAAEGRLSSLEEETRGEIARGVEENRRELKLLLQKVNHFIKTLLKVKELPAEVRALEKRLEALDSNVALLASGGGGRGGEGLTEVVDLAGTPAALVSPEEELERELAEMVKATEEWRKLEEEEREEEESALFGRR